VSVRFFLALPDWSFFAACFAFGFVSCGNEDVGDDFRDFHEYGDGLSLHVVLPP
jgi:hypothetical protein